MEMQKSNKIVSGYPLLFGYLGIFLMMIGGVIATPLLSLFFDKTDYIYIHYFLIPAGISIFIGFLLYLLILRKEKGKLLKNQEMILLNLIWLSAFIIGALPFLFYNNTNFSLALFESISGFTSTGLTVFNPNNLPKIFILYRSIMLLFGGIGLVLVLSSAISSRHGQLIYQAEGHNNQFVPNLLKGARWILGIYFYLIFIGTLLFIIFDTSQKMSIFDAINHSIACISNGGFSTKANNITYYDSIPIEIIAIILMILGSTSFFIFVQVIKGDFKKIFKNSELLYSICNFVVVFSLLYTILILNNKYNNYYLIYNYTNTEWLRYSLFQYISAQTTTGAQNVNNLLEGLPTIVLYILMIKMITGGQIGSAGGGVKQYRIIYILKGIWYTILKAFKSERTIQTKYINILGQKVVYEEQEFLKHLVFLFIYIGITLFGAFTIMAFGFSFLEATFEFISAIGTAGLSLGVTEKAAQQNHFILWILMFGMYIGRLEIMPVIFGGKRVIFDLFSKKHKQVMFND